MRQLLVLALTAVYLVFGSSANAAKHHRESPSACLARLNALEQTDINSARSDVQQKLQDGEYSSEDQYQRELSENVGLMKYSWDQVIEQECKGIDHGIGLYHDRTLTITGTIEPNGSFQATVN